MSRGVACVCALAALLSTGAVSQASTISQIEALASGTVVSLDGSNAVVTAILSQPGTFNGKSYTGWSFMVNDGTGSLLVYGTIPAGYTPTVGDAVNVNAKYSPFHQIPELGTITAISKVSSGNAVPAPLERTLEQLDQATLPMDLAGYMVTVHGVTIADSGNPTFGIANIQTNITDATDQIVMYYWPTSYSVENVNLFGMAMPSPTTPVDMTGFMSVYSSSPEFTPMTITPEPGTLALLALGGAALLRRRKA